MISTRPLALPDIPALRRIAQGLAALDAILCADWEGRYYSFNDRWAPGEQMASMRDGSGDEVFIHFDRAGVVIKGFAHEAPRSPFRAGATLAVQRGLQLAPGMLAGFPDALASFLAEPAFRLEETTFLIWRLAEDDAWRCGEFEAASDADPDGSGELLSPYQGRAADYVAFAADYFERAIEVDDAAHVLALGPLDPTILERLGSDRALAELREDLEEIGYPLA